LHQLGVVHAHADPPNAAQAEAHYQQALALYRALDMTLWLPQAEAALAQVDGQ
jgi:hypothetical protein